MKTVFHAWPYGRFIVIQNNLSRKKRTNQGSNLLGSSFTNRGNIRAPIQFWRERQPQYLKKWFFLKNRPVHFYTNNISVIWLVKQNKLNFACTSLLCLVDYIQAQNQFQLLPQIKCLIIFRVESRTISIDGNITDSRKGVGPRIELWGTPALTEYSCENSHLEPPEAVYYWEEKKYGQIWPEIP